jgi:DNA-binding MarR family transcriptional regulator
MVTTNIKLLLHISWIMWDLASFALSHARKICLLALATGPKVPSAIASAAGMNLSHISRALRELSEKGLVKCLTPNLTKNKIYQITPTGLEVVEKLKMLDDN